MKQLDEGTRYEITPVAGGVMVAIECLLPREIALLIADRAEQYEAVPGAPVEIIRLLVAEMRAAALGQDGRS